MRKPSAAFLVLLCQLALLAGCALEVGAFFERWDNSLERAEELSRQGQLERAIEVYREHMQRRLRLKNRPEWENPYFYLLLIGDIQLRAGRVNEALASYEEAERQAVHTSLISDRYRGVARWYEEQGQLTQAFDLLQKYRDRDPLLFDAMLDRIAKEIVQREEQQ